MSFNVDVLSSHSPLASGLTLFRKAGLVWRSGMSTQRTVQEAEMAPGSRSRRRRQYMSVHLRVQASLCLHHIAAVLSRLAAAFKQALPKETMLQCECTV